MTHAPAPFAARHADWRAFASAFALVLLSRLPWLGAGFGDDEDAWAIVATARHIAATGSYSASRLPGYPLPELAYALIAWRSPSLLNGLTALLSAVGAGCFAVALQRIGCRAVLLPSLALAFTPVIFISSVTTLDYVWSLSFVLVSLACVTARRPVGAGLALGCAIGCRITAGALLLPLAILLYQAAADQELRGRGVLRFALAAVATSAALFTPVVWSYGVGFFTFTNSAYPSLALLLYRGLVEVWGLAGLAVLASTPLLRLAQRTPAEVSGIAERRTYTLVSLLVIGIYTLAFLRLPDEGGYLIPIVPFVILLLGCVLRRALFRAVCALLLCAPFVLGIARPATLGGMPVSTLAVPVSFSGQQLALEPLRGPLLLDAARRAQRVALVQRIIAAAAHLPAASVVVVGGLLPDVLVMLGEPQQPTAPLWLHTLDEAQVRRFIAQGRVVYYLPFPGTVEYTGIDPERTQARPLDLALAR